MKGKKIISTLLALLLLASLPVSALAAEWDIGKGDITVNAGSGGQTVTQGGGAAVEDIAPVITGSTTENTLTINAEKDQTASVTLSGVNIDVSGKIDVSGMGKAAVSTNGEGNVSIELDSENTLKSGNHHAGLEKHNGGSLTIADQDENGKLTATGGYYGAGIGGMSGMGGSNITISGGEVNATGGTSAAGIGGGCKGDGSDITVSGDAKLKVQGGVGDNYHGAGAGIGGGSSNNSFDDPAPGAEVEPDTSRLTTNGSIEYYAPGADMENGTPTSTTPGTLSPPENPVEPIEPAVPEQPEAERGADAPLYRVTDRDGRDIVYTAEQKGSVLTVTVDEDLAVLTGGLSGIRTLKAQGVEKIIFVTNGATSAFMLSDLLEKGESGDTYKLTHDGEAVTFTLGEKMVNVSSILIKP